MNIHNMISGLFSVPNDFISRNFDNKYDDLIEDRNHQLESNPNYHYYCDNEGTMFQIPRTKSNLVDQFGLDCKPGDLDRNDFEHFISGGTRYINTNYPSDQKLPTNPKKIRRLVHDDEFGRGRNTADWYERSKDKLKNAYNIYNQSRLDSNYNSDFALRFKSRDLDPNFYSYYYGNDSKYLTQDEKKDLESKYNKLIKDRSELVKDYPQKYNAGLKDVLAYGTFVPIAPAVVALPMGRDIQAIKAGKVADNGAYHSVPYSVASKVSKLDREYHKNVLNTLKLAKKRSKLEDLK